MSGEGLAFEHRPSDSPFVERVWRSRSRATTTMISVARAHWDFVFWEGPDGVHAGIQGPESRASRAPVPPDSEFVGIRLALGARVRGLSMPSLVDGFLELPVEGRWFRLGADRVRLPEFAAAEEFVAHLVRKEALVVTDVADASVPERTRQRRYLATIGLPQRTVQQIERANVAAIRLRDGDGLPSAVAHESGYFDQPHLARSLRRFIGPSATELAGGAERHEPLSLLYKTGPRDDRYRPGHD